MDHEGPRSMAFSYDSTTCISQDLKKAIIFSRWLGSSNDAKQSVVLVFCKPGHAMQVNLLI